MRDTRVTVREVAADLREHLTRTPRQLPASYLYDALGSALFEAICHLPWYPIPRAETSLLTTHGAHIFALAGRPARVVELGPGGGDKLQAWLTAARATSSVDVHLVDVSKAALETAHSRLAVHEELTVITHEAEYEAGLARVTSEPTPGPTLVLFLGSNIGNFDPQGTVRFLRGVHAALEPGDALLLGTDLVKEPADLLLAYNDPLGVTAAFNRNLLTRLNREYRASFDERRFAHQAIWNPVESRIEMHLVSLERQRVSISGLDLELTFAQGEGIWTESSYKFEPADVAVRCERAGFTVVHQWIDEVSRFGITLVRT